MKPPTVLFLLLAATIALCEYPRMKYRGPPPYHKPPPFQQVPKKWQQHPPRPPIRSRPPLPPPPRGPPPSRPPIPVQMPNHHKIQMGAASINRPVAVPVRNFWKSTQTTFRAPTVEHYVTSAPVLPKKVFQSSPAILAQEYDFQVHSNNIPTPIKTIKQIGEKGPIHTIPAPNLSLADKPHVLEEVKKVQRQPFEERQPEVATYVQIQKSHQYQVTESPELSKQIYQNSFPTSNLQQADFYHLLPYQQTSLLLQDAQPQDYLQLASALPQQPQNFVDQLPHEQYAMDKSYEEVKQPTKDVSLVTATYNLEPEPSESIAHSQYVQNYFETRKNGEPDAKPSEKNKTVEGFYVSLPSKEAAETLANLQAAGKLNSNLMQRVKNGQDLPVSIYLPDDEASREDPSQSQEEEEPNYDDYGQDDLMTEEMSHGGEEPYGNRVKPKI